MKPVLNDFENASQDLLANSVVAITLPDCFPIISPMPHNPPFLSQRLIPELCLLDSSAQSAGLEAHERRLCQRMQKACPLLIPHVLTLEISCSNAPASSHGSITDLIIRFSKAFSTEPYYVAISNFIKNSNNCF